MRWMTSCIGGGLVVLGMLGQGAQQTASRSSPSQLRSSLLRFLDLAPSKAKPASTTASETQNLAALSRATALTFGIAAAARYNVIGGAHCLSLPRQREYAAAVGGAAWAGLEAHGNSPQWAQRGVCHAKR